MLQDWRVDRVDCGTVAGSDFPSRRREAGPLVVASHWLPNKRRGSLRSRWAQMRPRRRSRRGRSRSFGDGHLDFGDTRPIGFHLVVQLTAVSSESIAAVLDPSDQRFVYRRNAVQPAAVNDRRDFDHR